MAINGSPGLPHPHQGHWTGLLAFGGIVTVLGAALTGFAKPSVGAFNYWTYPTTFVAYVGLLFAILGLWGLVRGWNFPLAARESASESGAKKPSLNLTNLSSLDPLTPLETPIRPPSLSDHFKEPYTKGEPDYSAIPTDRAKLQKKNPFPDFTDEWAERDRLLQRCSSDVEETEAVWAWIQTVYNKLFAWKPTKAMEFKPDPSAVSGHLEVTKLSPAIALLMKGVKTNYSRQNLTLYGTRLAKILEDERASL